MTEGVISRIVTALALLAAALLALAVLAPAAFAQFPEEFDPLVEQCPPEFPMCPEGGEGDEGEGGEDDDPDDTPPPSDDDQVETTPVGGVGTGAGGAAANGLVPGLAFGGTALAAAAGAVIRRRLGG